eukprot:CAMPEP_0171259040 /NCGR_PEP_ID=MMETSP0790-20130122/54719_1 /TAXON_ID=2925 /ORGANISM="Alexandrium catenella, Strain OF101" /LENGTH=392 /DNA_ID=CAMNT_0011727295 /DNA_START=30 /DNA_END=1208 /DNA_ORIENTATION=+
MGSNCMASTSIGCLFCCQGCNAEKLRNTFTFLPPPASYTIEEQPHKGPGEELTVGGGKLVYVADGLQSFSCYQQAAEHADVRLLTTNGGDRIPVVWVRRSHASSTTSPPPSASKQPPMVLLHCHGNATDIGMMMGPYFELTKQLGVDVVGVEYSGYGMSTGSPSTRNVHADIEAAYNYVIGTGVPAERIVAYGQSVGSGPALGLAAKRPLGGVILHSPMLSGIKVIDPEPDHCCRPSCMYHCFDFFPNDQRMKAVNCPAFVIHGQVDDIIPFYHGYRLSEATPRQYRWPGYFPRTAGHNDIVEQNTHSYFEELRSFMVGLAERATSGAEIMPPKPMQVEMAEIKSGRESGNLGALSYAEPVVGPEDGRYNSLRRGQGTGRGARELKAAKEAA